MKQRPNTSATLSPAALDSAAHCLRTLAHPVRLRIIELLLEESLTVGELAETCKTTSAVMSTHLGLMRDRGLLDAERQGREVFYEVVDPELSGIIACMRRRFSE